MVELADTDVVPQLLARLQGLPAVSTLLLRVDDIGAAPRQLMAPLDSAARDFVAAIRRANLGDLVSQGPLELKSVEVIPPRIVVDQEVCTLYHSKLCDTDLLRVCWRCSPDGDAAPPAT